MVLFLGDEMSGAACGLCNREGMRVAALEGRNQETIGKAVDLLRSFLRRGDVVLLKGSRGMGLERISSALLGGAA